MEFKQAASHILDIVYEILSNHRQLEHLWVNKKQRLQNRYRILNFQLNIKQVYNWLENHGEVFLRKNQSVGKDLRKAKMLHLSHENFVKVLKNTVTNVEKLLASADDLVVTGEFEPKDIYSMTKELEQRMTLFLRRVEKRKQTLDLSVLFHTHVIELENWFNELKSHWKSLNIENKDTDTTCLELFERQLDILNEQRNVTLDACDKTKNEGETLLALLRESQPQAATQNNSYLNIESILNTIVTRYNEIDCLLNTNKACLEIYIQIKHFEKDSNEISSHLEHWYEELKFINESSDQDSKQSVENVETWLQAQIQTAGQMKGLVFELIQRGTDLTLNLDKLPNNSLAQTRRNRIQTIIEYLNEREKELHDLALKQQRKLGQKLQINQLELECQQLLAYIGSVELELFKKLRFARNINEADDIRKDYELFKMSIERLTISFNNLQTKTERILCCIDDNQSLKISKFESLMNTLNSKWQFLLIYMDNRNRLVMAQINFYKYTDQVTTVLDSLEREYAREEDWYEKSKCELDPETYLQSQLQIHNQKKQSFLKACNWARRTGETFQKYALRNICDAKKYSNCVLNQHDVELNTKYMIDDINSREERTIKSWNNRKNALDECFQYIIFEKSSKEALAWLQENENNYLSKFQAISQSKDEMKRFFKEFCDFTERLKVSLFIEKRVKLQL